MSTAPTQFDAPSAANKVVRIEVTNGNPFDMVIRMNRGGQVQRLGAVQTNETRTFTVPRGLGLPMGLQLTADPIGSRTLIRSWIFSVDRGDRILWSVGANATTSHLEIRHSTVS